MKQSELLRKQADMMDMAEKYGIDDWKKLALCREAGIWVQTWGILSTTVEYKFAIGVVEGKPVFEGDSIYFDGGLIENITTLYGDASRYSWNPPKPKTVMVELLVEDAEYISDALGGSGSCVRVAEACRKALKELK